MSSNREALMQLYERLQTGLSKADAYECLLEIAEVTCLIQARKQSLFWADTFSLAWRTIHKFTCEQNPLVDNACNLQFGILRAWTHAFVKPFVSNLEKSRHHIAPAQRQNFQQKQKIVAAFLLHLLSLELLTIQAVGSRDFCLSILDILVKCGLNFYTLTATIRFQKLIQNKLALLSPQSDGSDLFSYAEKDVHNTDDGEEPKAIRQIIREYSDTLHVTGFEDSMVDSDDFITWSAVGILRFTYSVWVESEDAHKANNIDPLTWLYVTSAVVEVYLKHGDLEMRKRGIEIAHKVLDVCPLDQLVIHQEPIVEAKFHELHQEMWLSDLIQHITSTMIQFYDVSDRSTSLKALQKLLDTIQLESRMTHVIRSCKLLMKLTLVCPYANISAYFIDKLRSDTVTAWTTLSSLPDIWVREIPQFLSVVLHSINERDLNECTELACSCLSLVRFFKLRDQANKTGVQNGALCTRLRTDLILFKKRLAILIQELQSNSPTKPFPAKVIHSRPYLLNAALESSLALFQT